MRPPLSRSKQKLSEETCIDILRSTLRGVLSVNGTDGYPYAMPLNHYYDDADGKIYFHSGKLGYKIDCIRGSNKGCFTVMDEGVRNAGEWWLSIRSVIVFGTLSILTDPQSISEISRKLSHKFTSDEGYIDREIEKYSSATALLVLTPEEICGKIVKEK